jgi:hypothetical protein
MKTEMTRKDAIKRLSPFARSTRGTDDELAAALELAVAALRHEDCYSHPYSHRASRLDRKALIFGRLVCRTGST